MKDFVVLEMKFVATWLIKFVPFFGVSVASSAMNSLVLYW